MSDVQDAQDELNPVFDVGDVVVLKSGGPGMTIESVNRTTGKAGCCWFDCSDICGHGYFPFECLRMPDGILAVESLDDDEDDE
jgi:uncharacterized protein YodC (DUF2158 family)